MIPNKKVLSLIHLAMNSKISDEHRLRLNLTDTTDMWRSVDHAVLPSLSMKYTQKNIKNLYRNNTFETSGTTWGEEFELIHAFYSISDVHDCYSLRNPIHRFINY